MADRKITFEVKAAGQAGAGGAGRSRGGLGATTGGQTRAEARQLQDQVKAAKEKQGIKDKPGGRDPQVQLIKSIDKLEKTVKKLEQSVSKQVKQTGRTPTAAQIAAGKPDSESAASTESKLKRMLGGVGAIGRGTNRVIGGVTKVAKAASGGFSGIGRLAGSLPFVGAVLGALGFAAGKIGEIGNNAISTRMQQIGTAGLAGTQSYGSLNRKYFGLAEQGQYAKAVASASGRLGGGDAYGGKYKFTGRMDKDGLPIYGMDRNAMIGADFGRDINEKGVLKSGGGTYSGAAHMAQIFGMGGAEVGRMVGLQGRLSGAKGAVGAENAFNKLLGTMFYQRGGKNANMGAEIPLVLQQITSDMEEAVRSGVNDSNLAVDMARSIASIQGSTAGGRNTMEAIAIAKSIGGVQKNAASGQWGNVSGYRMMTSALNVLKEDKNIQQSLVQKGAISGDIFDKQGKQLREMTSEEKEYAAKYINQEYNAQVQDRFMVDMATSLGGTTGTRAQRVARFSKNRSGIAPELNLTPQQEMTFVKAAEAHNANQRVKELEMKQDDLAAKKQQVGRKKTGISGFLESAGQTLGIKDTAADIDAQMKENALAIKEAKEAAKRTVTFGPDGLKRAQDAFDKRETAGSGVFDAAVKQTQRDEMAYTQASSKAMEFVIRTEQSFQNLAKQVDGPLASAIDKFTIGMTSGVDAISAGVDWISKKLKKDPVKEANKPWYKKAVDLL